MKGSLMLYQTMTVLLEYIDHLLQCSQMLNIAFNIYLIMLALCLMLSVTHYA